MTAVQYAMDQNLAPVVSTSSGNCELRYPLRRKGLPSLANKAFAQGITSVGSAGDDGAADCGDTQNPGLAVDIPASMPEVTGIGGTTLQDSGGTYWATATAQRRFPRSPIFRRRPGTTASRWLSRVWRRRR